VTHHTHIQLLFTVEPFHGTHCLRQWFYSLINSNLSYTLDFGFPEIADRLKNELKKTTETVKGKQLTKYSAEEKYSRPLKFFDFNNEVVSIDIQAFYNEDGQVDLYQTIVNLQDGSQRKSSMVEVLSFERVAAPPAEILNYLDQGAQK